MPDSQKIRIAISQCLLGENVRYDGTHKHNRYLTQTYADFFEWVPFCPENDSGMGTPREAMRLEGDFEAPRLITRNSRQDKTQQLLDYAVPRAEQFSRDDISGIILKKGSPSCGLFGIRPITDKKMPGDPGAGLFARELTKRYPHLPMEEEGRLNDPQLRELFIEKVFVYHRWRKQNNLGWNSKTLLKFHERHKYLLMSHHPANLKSLGQILSNLKSAPIEDIAQQYYTLLMETISQRATIKGHQNVLQHLMGYFKEQLTHDEKAELLDHIELYREKKLPLIVPVTLIKHYVRKYQQPYLLEQFYLEPHPMELMIRNSC